MSQTDLVLIGFFIFVLAVFLGLELISKVPSLLHTPLMSGTNFIHGIVVIGAITIASTVQDALAGVIAVIAVFLGTLNVVGGWVVTDRMLGMFRGAARRPCSPGGGPAPHRRRRPTRRDDPMTVALPPAWAVLGYLVAIVLFIRGIKMLTSPKTAHLGNRVAGVGMLVAIGVTLGIFHTGWQYIIPAAAIGARGRARSASAGCR